MPKNIVILLDGTCQEGGSREYLNTNIYRMHSLLEDRSPRQVVFYDRGVGIGWRKITGSIGGAGISDRILRAYRFIHDHYEDRDRIFLFGFSRGATEVRSLANFIEIFQFLPGSRPDLIKAAWKIYRTRPPFRWWARRRIHQFRRGAHRWDLRDPLDAVSAMISDRTRFEFLKHYRRTWDQRIAELKEEARGLGAAERLMLLETPERFMFDYRHGESRAADSLWNDIDNACWHVRNLTGVFDGKSDPVAWLRKFRREEAAARFSSASGGSRTGARVAVHFMGCFDTVAALGLPFPRIRSLIDRIPGMYHSFHDLKLSGFVNHACHAIALDEHRRAFLPEIWEADWTQSSHQVWFTGVHTDVGGGYMERGLSQVTLSWMLRMAHEAGLLVRNLGVQNPVVEDPKCVLHDSRDSLLKKWLFGKQTRKPSPPGNAVLHRSVLDRVNQDGPAWVWKGGQACESSNDDYRNRLLEVMGEDFDSGKYHVDEREPEPFDPGRLVEAQERLWTAWANAAYAPDFPRCLLWGAWDVTEGDRDKILELLANVPSAGLQREVALIYGRLGELDRAFAQLNEAYARHPTSLRGLALDHRAEALRGDGRFDELLKKLGSLGVG